MNKKTYLAILVLLLVAISYYLINKKPWGINYKDIADFAIADTAAIDKIFIADRNGNTVILEKKGPQTWTINNNKMADFGKIELLLSTVKNLAVLRPVPQSEHNSAVGDLATIGIKAQFYSKDETVKTLYIGSATQEQNGTYMLIEGSSKPYAVHIPGFFGYLTPRFISDSLTWRDRTVFNYQPEDIKSIEFNYENTANSFFIDNSNVQAPLIFDANKKVKTISDIKFLRFYIATFKQLYFDGYDENKSQRLNDSILKSKPICVINITNKNGSIQSLKLYTKAIDKHTKQAINEETGEYLKFDTERYWAFLNDDKSLMLIQQYNFGKIMITIDGFK
ncbi:MAG: DUF4340 domain-containing protein [Bacteroidia bacterium]|nr:DUF4340 domain-containing protein [Bacteroidia bacterium]